MQHFRIYSMRLAKGKKGLELTMGPMVISILVLTVLIVLILIFTGVLGGVFVPGLSDCAARGGNCDQGSNCGGFDSGYTKVAGAHCLGSDEKLDKKTVCCVPTS